MSSIANTNHCGPDGESQYVETRPPGVRTNLRGVQQNEQRADVEGQACRHLWSGGLDRSVVAKEFATEGAEVFLSGRSNANLEDVAKQITADGGVAHVAVVDAEDSAAVDGYIDGIAGETGSIDWLHRKFHAESRDDVSPSGVRVVCVRTSAMPETRTIQDTRDMMSGAMNIAEEQVFATLANLTLLKVSRLLPIRRGQPPLLLPTTRG